VNAAKEAREGTRSAGSPTDLTRGLLRDIAGIEMIFGDVKGRSDVGRGHRLWSGSEGALGSDYVTGAHCASETNTRQLCRDSPIRFGNNHHKMKFVRYAQLTRKTLGGPRDMAEIIFCLWSLFGKGAS
jgi:hypothetical protein